MIIAIKEKDRVVIGYTMTDSWGKLSDKDYVDEENLPIRYTKDGKVLICCIMDRSSDKLLYDEALLNMEINPKSIVKDVIPYVKELLQKGDKRIDDKGKWGNSLTICDNEHIYDISPTFVFREVDDYVYHGCDSDEKIMVLDATKGCSAEERIIKTARFISKLCRESTFPWVITDTKSKQFKVIYEGETR